MSLIFSWSCCSGTLHPFHPWHRSLFEWQSQFGVYVRSVYWDNWCWCWDIIRTWIILPSLAFLRVSRTSPIVRLGAGDSSCSSSEGRRTSKSPGMPSISEDISSLSISAKLWLFLILFFTKAKASCFSLINPICTPQENLVLSYILFTL